jgi:hypothetical protein
MTLYLPKYVVLVQIAVIFLGWLTITRNKRVSSCAFITFSWAVSRTVLLSSTEPGYCLLIVPLFNIAVSHWFKIVRKAFWYLILQTRKYFRICTGTQVGLFDEKTRDWKSHATVSLIGKNVTSGHYIYYSCQSFEIVASQTQKLLEDPFTFKKIIRQKNYIGDLSYPTKPINV